ncbi:MtrB/PioB family outer membrane beta-barrel protein [Porticoccus sp.]
MLLRSARLFTTALSFLFAPVAIGEEQSGSSLDVGGQVELGAGVVHTDDGHFGQYANHYQTDGLFGLGSLELYWRDANDPFLYGGLTLLSGVDQLALDVSHGRQGDYRVGVNYRAFEALTRDNISTAYANRGTEQQLPPDFTDLAGADRFNTQTGVKRERAELGLFRQLASWKFSATANSERKTGSKLTGASERFGDATLLLAPVDYTHNSLDLQAGFTGDGWALNGNSYLSWFYNHDRAHSFENPNNLSAPVRTLDTAPDNNFLLFSLDGYYQTSPLSQLSWYLARGEAQQNDDWVQPTFSGPLMPDSLDARRVDTRFRLGFAAKPSRVFSYRLKAEYHDRNNRTDVIEFAPASYSHLYDGTRTALDLSGSYRLPGSLRLKGGAELTRIERTTKSLEKFTDDSDEQRYWLQLQMPVISRLSWSVYLEMTERDVDLSSERINALSMDMPNQALPEYLMPGRNWQYGLKGEIPIIDTLYLLGSLERQHNNFDNRFFGLQSREIDEATFTLAWQPHKTFSLNVFAVYQTVESPQEGLEFHPTGATTHANAHWRQTFDDDFYNIGFNLRWQLSPALAGTLAYSFSDNDSRYTSTWLEDTDTGEAAGTRDQLPGWGTTVQRLEAGADWQFSPRTLLKVRYLYEHFDSDDFAWQDDFNVLGLGWRSPAYDAHGLVISASYYFESIGR